MRVDDARIVGVGFRIIAKELDQRLLGLGNEGVCDRLVNIRVAWRGAPLAAPRHRTPNDLLRGVGDVGGLVNERRVHPAEFQQDRREVFRGGSRDDLPHVGAAGEKDEVERQLQKFGVL